ncbi:ABC transporter ATP-binding protein [Iodobacter ciconiae]|uniref:ABC transporter ATP-binding protein n=1 Tax=Iodobacter ciconiae TaxID=2496266 RepID=A0A3S8ZWM6_9NEIS|nr:ABC transporter ATP-binding protein [Iodobacter ciconiae]AZN37869.1 ABC transporter ATP-binding protein [Iodobacter ciconiae]
MALIKVNNLSKCFRIYPSRRHKLASLFGIDSHSIQKWTLKNITFSIDPGESVAIIGRNGSGKSTLLKIICQTLHPTEGEIIVNGRIGALLELGIGFHEELSGRENVYISGQLLGMSRHEIEIRMEEIINFSELSEYIDIPLKKYSSGMQMRLAFSVATALRPAILIVDEALSVGDAYFQHKCFDRIKQFQKSGTSLLFVSHDPLAIKTLCERAILIDKGIMLADDHPAAILDYYNALIARAENNKISIDEGVRSGSGEAKLTAVDIFNENEPAQVVLSGSKIKLRVSYKVIKKIPDLTIGFLIKDRVGNEVFGSNTYVLQKTPPFVQGGQYQVIFELPDFRLAAGSYNISVALHSSYHHLSNNYDWWDHAATITVISEQIFAGVVRLDTQYCELI